MEPELRLDGDGEGRRRYVRLRDGDREVWVDLERLEVLEVLDRELPVLPEVPELPEACEDGGGEGDGCRRLSRCREGSDDLSDAAGPEGAGVGSCLASTLITLILVPHLVPSSSFTPTPSALIPTSSVFTPFPSRSRRSELGAGEGRRRGTAGLGSSCLAMGGVGVVGGNVDDIGLLLLHALLVLRLCLCSALPMAVGGPRG